MANETGNIYSGKFPAFPPFFDAAGLIEMSRNTLTETAKLNSKWSTTLQALGKEWTGFIGARLHEDTQLLQTLRECKGLPDMQRAYVQFLEKASSQYGEETQRLMRITQGAVEEAAHVAQERINGTTGNGRDSEDSNSEASNSMSPSKMKKASPSHRNRA
jgi:Phasin protein